MTTATKTAYTPKNVAEVITPAIIAAGPAVVALFTEYVNVSNAYHARKASKAHMQAAYKAYDHALLAAHRAADPLAGEPLWAAYTVLAAAADAADAYFTTVIEQAPDPEYDAYLATLPVSYPLPEDF